MVPHEPEFERVPFAVASRLPPAWDSPEMKQRIYSTFERLQVALACGNARHAGMLMASLRKLTDAAERRHQALLGTLDQARLELLGEVAATL